MKALENQCQEQETKAHKVKAPYFAMQKINIINKPDNELKLCKTANI